MAEFELDYFYSEQADQFTFYRIPRALFTEERFKGMSSDAKILYGLFIDRMSLSQKNAWMDEKGRVFIFFPMDEILEYIGCAKEKATKVLNELENEVGLIERKRQGLGKPNRIYVKSFVVEREANAKTPENRNSRSSKIELQKFENRTQPRLSIIRLIITRVYIYKKKRKVQKKKRTIHEKPALKRLLTTS